MKHSAGALALLLRANELEDFETWLFECRQSLQNAAANLAGAKWGEIAWTISEAVAERRPLSVVLEELVALHKLLDLRFVDDLDSPEADCFLAIHPDSEINGLVGEIRINQHSIF